MRHDYVLYILSFLCFILGASLFMGYVGYIEVTIGRKENDLFATIFSLTLGFALALLGLVFRVEGAKQMIPAPTPVPIPSTRPKRIEPKLEKESRESVRPRAQLKRESRSNVVVSLTLFGTGVAALTISVLNSSSELAFIGLGLTFWGVVFLYIKTEKSSPEALLDRTAFPSLATLNQMISELGFKGKAVYMPPKYLADLESSRVFIAKKEKARLPTPDQIQKEERMFVTKPEGILLTPPGADLTRFFEKTLDTSFTKVDLRYLEKHMPRLFVEDLEIAEKVEVKAKKSKFYVEIENSIYKNIHTKSEKLPNIRTSIGCPICSAIACAVAKASGRLVTIERDQTSEDGQTIVIEYSLLQGQNEET